MPRRATWVWIPFLFLALAWGSSYLWVELAVGTLPTLTLIAARLVIGTAFLGIVVAVARERLPRSVRTYGHLLVLSIFNMVLPLALTVAGQRSIDSGLASILTATLPLMTLVIAPLFLPDERFTWGRVAGLAIGFAGVMTLVVPDLVDFGGSDLTGELLILGASLSYAIANVYAARYVRGLRPMIPALFQVGFAAAIATVLALVVEQPIGRVDPSPEAVLAVVCLGLFASGLAYLCYFTVLDHWGATRTSTIAYLLPVVGIGLGAAVLGEAVTVERVAGTVLVIAGVVLVDAAPNLRRLLARGPEAVPAEAASPGTATWDA